MKFLFAFLFLFVAGPLPVMAFGVYQSEVTKPYEIIPLTAGLESKQAHIGHLDNFPIMYEVTITATTTLTAQLSQQYRSSAKPLDLALMVVREDDKGGGVSEIARVHPVAADWTVRKDSVYGMSFWESQSTSNELRPGTYRIEVTTPNNLGRYMLLLGTTEESLGYFGTISHVRQVQQGFGLSIARMLVSSYVYYPLGIILLLFVIHRTWRARKSIAHVA